MLITVLTQCIQEIVVPFPLYRSKYLPREIILFCLKFYSAMKIHTGNRKQSVPLHASCEPADFLSLGKGPYSGGSKKPRILDMTLPDRKIILKISYALYAFLHFTFSFSCLFKQTMRLICPFYGSYPAVPPCYPWHLKLAKNSLNLNKRVSSFSFTYKDLIWLEVAPSRLLFLSQKADLDLTRKFPWPYNFCDCIDMSILLYCWPQGTENRQLIFL